MQVSLNAYRGRPVYEQIFRDKHCRLNLGHPEGAQSLALLQDAVVT